LKFVFQIKFNRRPYYAAGPTRQRPTPYCAALHYSAGATRQRPLPSFVSASTARHPLERPRSGWCQPPAACRSGRGFAPPRVAVWHPRHLALTPLPCLTPPLLQKASAAPPAPSHSSPLLSHARPREHTPLLPPPPRLAASPGPHPLLSLLSL
jgi:hypothetical protein